MAISAKCGARRFGLMSAVSGPALTADMLDGSSHFRMFLNWLQAFANRILRRPKAASSYAAAGVATWDDRIDPASLRTPELQSRGDVAHQVMYITRVLR